MAYEARALHHAELADEVDRWVRDRREWCGVVVGRLGVPDEPGDGLAPVRLDEVG